MKEVGNLQPFKTKACASAADGCSHREGDIAAAMQGAELLWVEGDGQTDVYLSTSVTAIAVSTIKGEMAFLRGFQSSKRLRHTPKKQ